MDNYTISYFDITDCHNFDSKLMAKSIDGDLCMLKSDSYLKDEIDIVLKFSDELSHTDKYLEILVDDVDVASRISSDCVAITSTIPYDRFESLARYLTDTHRPSVALIYDDDDYIERLKLIKSLDDDFPVLLRVAHDNPSEVIRCLSDNGISTKNIHFNYYPLCFSEQFGFDVEHGVIIEKFSTDEGLYSLPLKDRMSMMGKTRRCLECGLMGVCHGFLKSNPHIPSMLSPTDSDVKYGSMITLIKEKSNEVMCYRAPLDLYDDKFMSTRVGYDFKSIYDIRCGVVPRGNDFIGVYDVVKDAVFTRVNRKCRMVTEREDGMMSLNFGMTGNDNKRLYHPHSLAEGNYSILGKIDLTHIHKDSDYIINSIIDGFVSFVSRYIDESHIRVNGHDVWYYDSKIMDGEHMVLDGRYLCFTFNVYSSHYDYGKWTDILNTWDESYRPNYIGLLDLDDRLTHDCVGDGLYDMVKGIVK